MNRHDAEAQLRHPHLIRSLLLVLSLLWVQGLAGQSNLSSSAVSPSLPDGPGRELVSSKCAKCHTLNKVTKERHSDPEWRELLRKMELQGLEVSGVQKGTLLEYLKTNLGKPSSAADHTMTNPASNQSDDRFKTDILLVLAHQDDDTAFSGYLSRAIFDEHRRIAAVFITRGDAGTSSDGTERGEALAAVREVEARQALGFLGVSNVWFLHAPNAPNRQDVLHALEYWDHGSVLGQLVRLVRLTRPEVILSMFPGPVAGENHPDHQAAGVLATEAFDLAADPVTFPEQIATPINEEPSGHSPEGLDPWQPKKIYFWSDAYDSGNSLWADPPPASPFRKNFLEGAGPAYSRRDVSPTQHVSYASLAAQQASFYMSQDGAIAKAALASGDFRSFDDPDRLILGKSLVGGDIAGDVFEGVSSDSVPLTVEARVYSHAADEPSIEFGGSWKFYKDFYAAHQMSRLAQLLPIPEVSLRMGMRLEVPLLLHNETSETQAIRVAMVLPPGWTDLTSYPTSPIKPHDTFSVHAILLTPSTGAARWQEITWKAESNARQVGTATLRACLRAPVGQPSQK